MTFKVSGLGLHPLSHSCQLAAQWSRESCSACWHVLDHLRCNIDNNQVCIPGTKKCALRTRPRSTLCAAVCLPCTRPVIAVFAPTVGFRLDKRLALYITLPSNAIESAMSAEHFIMEATHPRPLPIERNDLGTSTWTKMHSTLNFMPEATASDATLESLDGRVVSVRTFTLQLYRMR